MSNPLAENCQAFKLDASGKVIGVQLGITTIPGAKYEVYSVELIDETKAGGNTVASCIVLDKNNVPNSEQVILTWPGSKPPFEGSGLAGNGQNVHVITNEYIPPKLGPLALHTGEFNAPTSDIVYGFGLPYKHHISFKIVFREKGASSNPDVDNRIIELEKKVLDHEARLKKLEATGGAGGSQLPTHRMGVHWIPVATNYSAHKEYIRALKPAAIKVVNGNKGDLLHCLANLDTNGILVVRDHARSEQQDFLARDPVGCGKQHALEWKKDFSTGGKYSGVPTDQVVVCAINEPVVFGPTEEKRLLDYTRAFLTDLKAYGLRGLCLNLSVGWPRDKGPNTPPTWEGFLELEKLINDGNHILGLHEYWYDDPDDSWSSKGFGWYAQRHWACPLRVPIIIGECGLTRKANMEKWKQAGYPQPTGWIGNKTPDAYAEQLWRYARKCTPNVIAVLPFTTGFASSDWAEDATDAAHPFILKRKESYHFPENFPITPKPIGGGGNVIPFEPSEKDTLIFPAFSGKVTGFFGQVYKNSSGGSYAHEGLDISKPVGTPVYAPADGIVAWADTDTLYGEYIRTYHKDLNVCFFFAHLSKRLVQSGKSIKQGDLIGYTGNTGNSSGPHLHFEVRPTLPNSTAYKPGISVHGNSRVDPLGYAQGWISAGNKIVEK